MVQGQNMEHHQKQKVNDRGEPHQGAPIAKPTIWRSASIASYVAVKTILQPGAERRVL